MVAAETATQWLTDYHNLLARHDLDATTLMDSALTPANREQPALFSLAQLLANPDLLQQQVLNDYQDADHPRLRKARLSVLHQSLVLQIIGPLVIRLFRDGSSAALDPRRVFLCPTTSTPADPSRWQYAASEQEILEPEAFIRILSEQMQDWYGVFRHHFGVSPGAYWSSVGLALGAPYSVVWNRVNPAELCKQAGSWLAQFKCEANRYIDWIPAEFSQQWCAIPQRKGCCLKYLLPGGGYCGTCGIYRKERIS